MVFSDAETEALVTSSSMSVSTTLPPAARASTAAEPATAWTLVALATGVVPTPVVDRSVASRVRLLDASLP